MWSHRARHPRIIRPRWCSRPLNAQLQARWYHVDGRPRLSQVWTPTQRAPSDKDTSANQDLVRAGFLSWPSSGIPHLLPLGRRVQDKLIKLIEKHMQSVGASQVELAVLSSAGLWEKTGRIRAVGSELFRLRDRHKHLYFLGPTHEEEITNLVKTTRPSYKSLPLKLFQITKKFRDEKRPRGGLLRAREFLMKDLYTFDWSEEAALRTYEQIRRAYAAIFKDLKLPVKAVDGSSGSIGGNLSHEYQLATDFGEDRIISCNLCDYAVNEEIAQIPIEYGQVGQSQSIRKRVLVTKDRKTLINVWYPRRAGKHEFSNDDVDLHAVKRLIPELDAGEERPELAWYEALLHNPAGSPDGPRLINLLDARLKTDYAISISEDRASVPMWPIRAVENNIDLERIPIRTINKKSTSTKRDLNLLRALDGDKCPSCGNGHLTTYKSLELGHTFHLGTRYSVPFAAAVQVPGHLKGGEVFDPTAVAQAQARQAEAEKIKPTPVHIARNVDPGPDWRMVRLETDAGIDTDRDSAANLAPQINVAETLSSETNESILEQLSPQPGVSVDETLSAGVEAQQSLPGGEAARDAGQDLTEEAAKAPLEVNNLGGKSREQTTDELAQEVEELDQGIEKDHAMLAEVKQMTETKRTTNTHPTPTPEISKPERRVYLQMGCHGIGVSRIIGAAANHLSHAKGLSWPRAIAPYEVVVIPPNPPSRQSENFEQASLQARLDGEMILNRLLDARFEPPSRDVVPRHLVMEYHTKLDPVLDDRDQVRAWKMKDADLIGFPVVVVMGRAWEAEKKVEVQCRRLRVKEDVGVEKLCGFVKELLDQL